jgi:hypothetical protein
MSVANGRDRLKLSCALDREQIAIEGNERCGCTVEV